jgi:uncharacterized membrane protein
MWLFKEQGLSDALRASHVISAVMWMGLLWFFNFVQTPAYAEMDPAARNNAFDKLTWRALWWFRWAAAATLVFGFLIIFQLTDVYMDSDFWKSTSGLTLALGIIMGITMAANVWMVIWPNQQIVIGNARTVQGGGDANPEAPAAGRRGAMASRQNTIFSFPVLFFMLGASHFYGYSYWDQSLSGSTWFIYFLIGVIIIAVLELNALGKLSGTGNGGLNVIYETHINAMYAGFALIAFWYIFAEILLKQ